MKRHAALALLLFAVSAAPSPAMAAPGFSAEIFALSPELPGVGASITMAVQLSNPSSVDITDLSAQFLISNAPLSGRSQIPEVLAGNTMPTYRLVEAGAATGIDLTSGATTTITLSATPKQLGLSANRPGAYVFGVQLVGTASGRSVSERRITFLPWQSGKVRNTLGVVTVWTVTAPPSRGVDGVFFDDSLARAIATGGRLRLQLDAMRAVANAVWLIDPLLAESVQAIANGARITQSDDSVRASSDGERQAAALWLADLTEATSSGTVAALPVGDLDLRAAMKFGRTSVARNALTQAAARLAVVLQVPELPLIVPLYTGAVTDSAWKFLHRVGAIAAVVSDQGYPAEQSQYTPTSAVSVNAFSGLVVAADHITSASPSASGRSAVINRQTFAAQLLMTYLERPNSKRVITVAISPTWTPDALVATTAVLNARWIAHASIGDAAAAGVEPRGSNITVATRRQRLQDLDIGHSVTQQRLLAHLTSDETFTATVNDAVIGGLSRWFTGRDGRDRYSPRSITELTMLASSVRVITRGEIVFGGERGVVPVTVANGLPVAIDILLRATGYPSVRVQPTPLTAIHINAGKRVSVEVPTRVSGSGDAYLGLHLEAKDKTSVDLPVLLTVRSAAYARVAGYLVLGAFVLLLLLIASNTVKRIRSRGQKEAAE